jgi:CRP-like cAMP-binding protein
LAALHLQLLEKVRNLAGLPVPNAEWAAFAQHWQPFAFAEGAYVTDFDQQEDYFYWVVSGVQRAFFVHDGNEVCVGFSYHPDFTGIYDAFLDRSPARYALQALAPTQLLGLHYTAYRHALDTYPWFERMIRVFMEHMFLAKARHEVAVFTYSAEERYKRLLKAAPHLFQMVPQKHLASYLAMSPETFSHLRSKVRG